MPVLARCGCCATMPVISVQKSTATVGTEVDARAKFLLRCECVTCSCHPLYWGNRRPQCGSEKSNVLASDAIFCRIWVFINSNIFIMKHTCSKMRWKSRNWMQSGVQTHDLVLQRRLTVLGEYTRGHGNIQTNKKKRANTLRHMHPARCLWYSAFGCTHSAVL